MERRDFVKTMAAGAALGIITQDTQAVGIHNSSKKTDVTDRNDRAYWCDLMYRMAEPVLSAMAKGELRKRMSVEVSPTWDGRDKSATCSYLYIIRCP